MSLVKERVVKEQVSSLLYKYINIYIYTVVLMLYVQEAPNKLAFSF